MMNGEGFAVVSCVKVLSQYFPEETEENHGKHQSG
jgi:hypothetical protein